MSLNLAPLIAHRGASYYRPENTLLAMQYAAELGAKWVEFDVTLTQDNHLVVFHDRNVRDKTNGCGAVNKISYAELSKLDAGSWFAKEYHACRVASFDAMLQCCAHLNLQMNIELKPYDDRYETTVKMMMSALNKSWPEHLPQPLISSFSVDMLAEVRRQLPQAQLGLLVKRWRKAELQHVSTLNCISVHIQQEYVTEKIVHSLKQQQLLVLAYVVNNPRRAQTLLSWGVDSLFSDDPLLL